MGWAIVALRKDGPAFAAPRAQGTARIHGVGEALIFAGSVACASATTWMLHVVLGNATVNAQVDAAAVGWSTLMWLGYRWDLILMWLLLAVGLVGATAKLGHRRAAPSTPAAIAGGNRPPHRPGSRTPGPKPR